MCKNQRSYGILYDIAEGGNSIGAAGSRSKKTGEFVANCDEFLLSSWITRSRKAERWSIC